MNVDSLFDPVIQGGALGLCVILLAMLFWLNKQLLALLSKTNEIIAANTEAIRDVAELQANDRDVLQDIRDRLLTHRCLQDRR